MNKILANPEIEVAFKLSSKTFDKEEVMKGIPLVLKGFGKGFCVVSFRSGKLAIYTDLKGIPKEVQSIRLSDTNRFAKNNDIIKGMCQYQNDIYILTGQGFVDKLVIGERGTFHTQAEKVELAFPKGLTGEFIKIERNHLVVVLSDKAARLVVAGE